MPGRVYLIGNRLFDIDCYKLGATKGFLEDRVNELNREPGTANPDAYYLVYSCPTLDVGRAAKELKKLLQPCRVTRVRREFFDVRLKGYTLASLIPLIVDVCRRCDAQVDADEREVALAELRRQRPLELNPSVSENFQEAMSAFEAGDWEKAAKAFARVGPQDVDDERVQQAIGSMYLTGAGFEQDFLRAHCYYVGQSEEQVLDVARIDLGLLYPQIKLGSVTCVTPEDERKRVLSWFTNTAAELRKVRADPRLQTDYDGAHRRLLIQARSEDTVQRTRAFFNLGFLHVGRFMHQANYHDGVEYFRLAIETLPLLVSQDLQEFVRRYEARHPKVLRAQADEAL